VPKPNRRLGRLQHTLYKRFPLLQKAVRTAIYWRQEALVPGFVINPKLQALVQKLAEKHLARQVSDPVLRAKLTPSYTIGCKRILQANDYYPALARDNVDVITDSIAEVTPTGIVDADGVTREVDTIILATGFHVTDRPAGSRLRGTGGLTLDDAWEGSPKAYYGTTIAGFPNLFMILGPNTGLGHSSIIYMIEAQIEHILGALKTIRANGLGAIDVRPDVMAVHNDELQRRMSRTVWSAGGCESWYIDATGRNSTLWPDFTFRFRKQVAAFDPAVYDQTPRRVRTEEPVAA
jgi:cation diffusion facilitator CzcD-associated flavoprotein CzcO